MSRSEHRPPPPPPQPSTVIAEPATVQACAEDRANAGGVAPGHVTATPHTLGRRS